MPKMKSMKSATKRFRKTASGQLKRGKAFASHILKKKSTKRKRNLRHSTLVSHADLKRVLMMIVD